MSPSKKSPNTRDSSRERRNNSRRSWSQWLWHRTFEDCCDFSRRDNEYSHNKGDDKALSPVSLSEFLIFFFSKLLLEVCGAAGAVWGFCEIFKWRRIENTDDFRCIVTLAFVVFAVRFYWHAKHFWQHGYDFPYVKLHHRRSHWYHGLQVFSSKFLLQVCGAAGAVWGASETTGLRHPLNREWWRIAAWVTTVLFGMRWLIELFSYCLVCRRSQQSQWYMKLKNEVVPFCEATITKFVLEVCGSSGAVWGFADILSIRDQTPDTATGWRIVALLIGGIFLVRWILHVKEFLHLGEESPLVTEPPHVELLQTAPGSFESKEEDDEETGIISDQNNNYTYGSTKSTTKSTSDDDREALISK